MGGCGASDVHGGTKRSVVEREVASNSGGAFYFGKVANHWDCSGACVTGFITHQYIKRKLKYRMISEHVSELGHYLMFTTFSSPPEPPEDIGED